MMETQWASPRYDVVKFNLILCDHACIAKEAHPDPMYQTHLHVGVDDGQS